MDATSLSATAALAGSAVGGLTSFMATWLSQKNQLKAQFLLHDKERRQELYRTFVEDASNAYIEGLMSDSPDLAKIVNIYALISRMRILSSSQVVNEAVSVAQVIMRSYAEPNKTLSDIRSMVDQRTFDPMHNFSEVCRLELEQLA